MDFMLYIKTEKKNVCYKVGYSKHFRLPHNSEHADLREDPEDLSQEKISQVVFIWSRVVPGRRVTLSPELSQFHERIYEKTCPYPKTWPSRFERLARVIFKYLLWLPFLISGTLKHRRRLFWSILKKRTKSSLARGGSVWRVTLLPGTTLLHINRPSVSSSALLLSR